MSTKNYQKSQTCDILTSFCQKKHLVIFSSGGFNKIKSKYNIPTNTTAGNNKAGFWNFFRKLDIQKMDIRRILLVLLLIYSISGSSDHNVNDDNNDSENSEGSDNVFDTEDEDVGKKHL